MNTRSLTQTKPSLSAPAQTGLLQRKCSQCSEQEKLLQRQAVNQVEVSGVPAIAHDGLNSPNQPPDSTTRAFTESRFGHDFSQIPVHNYTECQSKQKGVLQTKLQIGEVGDRYEQEADRIANQVMSMSDAKQSIQREVMPEKEEEIQTKPLVATITPLMQFEKMPDEEEEKIQTKEMSNQGVQAGGNLESHLNSSKGGGNPLPDDVRSFMKPRFGADFSQVRVHTGSKAVQMNQDLHAEAFTYKQDIYFGAGKAPAKDALTAHELTHVVQQMGGVQAKCEACGNLAEKDKEPLIQTQSNTSTQTYVQRVHIENGRKKFDCSDFLGDSKLEACLNDEDRLSPLETGDSVIKIQKGLQKDGLDLGKDGIKGVYGADTGKAVMAFKQKHNLGSTQFPDVGPGTTKKLDELCATKPPTPKLPKPELPGNCVPSAANPFCLPIPTTDAPCQPFPDIASAEVLRNSMSIAIPRLTALDTRCPEVKPVWETYFAATSTPFPFSGTSSCVVNDAKTDGDASAEANRAAKGHLEDILDNLPITLLDITPSPFPFPGKPLAERRMPLEEAISPKLRGFLHHQFIYNDKHNAAANIAGGAGINGQGSDIFGDDDRLVGGTVVIEVSAIDPTSGRVIGQVRWQPHIHVKDTVDFCPGNLTNSAILREFTVPMSKLEAMGLVRDVPITIDYDLDVQQANFNVLPLTRPPRPNP